LNPSFEIIEHTADVGLHAWGESGVDLFVSAALGMATILCEGKPPEGTEETKRIRIESDSVDELFLDWLREILFQTERNGVVYTAFHIEGSNLSSESIGKYFILASLRGNKSTRIGHGICTEIKAVTRHRFSLSKEPVWEASVLFDV